MRSLRRHLKPGTPDRFNRGVGASPLEHGIDGNELVQRDDEPEHELIAPLRAFVAEAALRQKSARPAA